jgi:hypothetical protein
MKKIFPLFLSILFAGISLINAYGQDSVRKTTAAKPAKLNPYTKSRMPGYYYKAKHPYQKVISTGVQPADTSKNPPGVKPPDAPTDKSLNGQYQYLLSKVYYYQQPLVGAFHKSFMDTLGLARKALKDAKATAALQAKTIDSLQTNEKASSESLSASNARVSAINMFGIELNKVTYNLLMWGLVVLFGVIAIVVIARSGANSREARYRTQLYNELEEEHKNYKAKANEKEKKLARELQTERNKLDDLLGRG